MAKVTASKGKKENKSNLKETAKNLLKKASNVSPLPGAVSTIKKITTIGKKEDSSPVKNLKEKLNKPAAEPEKTNEYKRKRRLPPFDLKTMPNIPRNPDTFRPMPDNPKNRNQFKPLPRIPDDKPKYQLLNKGGRAGLRGGGICKKGMNKKARGANS